MTQATLFSQAAIRTPWQRLEACRQAARQYAVDHSPQQRTDFAISFCHKALCSYWHAMRNRFGSTLRVRPYAQGSVPLEADRAAQAAGMGLLAAGIGGEEASFLLSSLYAVLLPESLRAEQGIYFTPPAVVDRLLDLVTEAGIEWSCGSVLDPACGGGAFLGPVAKRMVASTHKPKAKPDTIVHSIGRRISGIEIDSFSAWMSAVMLDIALLPTTGRTPLRLPRVIANRDALRVPEAWAGEGFDLVIGNPPYGKVSLTPQMRSRYKASLYGHANLYGMFLHQAMQFCRDGALIAYVTPTSFLGGQYFKNLRKLLVRKARPVAIDFVSDRSGVFEDVLQETALVVLRVGNSRNKVAVSLAKPDGLGQPCAVQSLGKVTVPKQGGGPWLLPRDAAQARLLRRAESMPNRLGDFGYTVKTGPLVWNRHKEQLADGPGVARYPLIWAESVRSDGAFRFSHGQKNHAPYISLRPGQDHLLTSASCVLVQRTTAKEQARRIMAACLPVPFLASHGGAVVENHLNIVCPAGPEPKVSMEVLRSLLNSKLIDQFFRCINGSVAVSAYELLSLPLPDWECVDRVRTAAAGGADQEEIDILLARWIGGKV